MICRNYQDGEKLNVADLNTVTVIVDRSETALTETGMNHWPSDMNGPPHKHEQKEQIFFITDGYADIIVSGEKFPVKLHDLIYVPANSVHQPIMGKDSAVEYILFNAFLNEDKEGHKSFADHISKVKQTRKEQAEKQAAITEGYTDRQVSQSKGKHVTNVNQLIKNADDRSNKWTLLEASETQRCSAQLVHIAPKIEHPLDMPKHTENTIFVIEGSGSIKNGEQPQAIAKDDVVFLPEGSKYQIETGPEGISVICLFTHLK